MPLIGVSEPRSSRLKDKMRGEGEVMVKETFIQNVIETNDLLSILQSKGSSCIVLPQKNIYDSPLRSNSLVRAQLKMKPRLSLGLCSREEALEASRNFPSSDVLIGRNDGIGHLNGLCALKGNSLSLCQASATSDKSGTSARNSSASDSQLAENEKESAVHSDGLLDQGLLSCVTCGILSFTCVAVVHPREAASRYLMSADCGFLNDQNVGGENYDGNNGTNWNRGTSDMLYGSGQLESHIQGRANDNLVHCSALSAHISDHSVEDDGSDAADQRGVSALDLLASAYGASSDSEGEGLPASSPCTDENNDLNYEERFTNKDPLVSDSQDGLYNEYSHCTDGYDDMNGSRSTIAKRCELKPEFLDEDQPGMVDDLEDSGEMDDREDSREMEDSGEMETSNSSIKSMGEAIDADCKELNSSSHTTATAIIHQGDVKMGTIASGSPDIFRQPDAFYGSAEVTEYSAKTSPSRNFDTIRKNSVISAIERSDKDSSRMHVFCLEHALEVEKILHPFGGVNIMILCHPDYPKIEQEAKSLAEELERDYEWKYIDFMVPTLKDQERIRAALEDEESMPTSSDWAVKLGINLYYSANLSKSPLYNKQMPYNAVIYRAFGCSSPNNSPIKPKPTKRKHGRQRKMVIAGKWCGKVWMANQVHPFLAHRKDAQEQEHAGKLHSENNSDMKPNELESEIRNKRIVSKKNSSGDNISAARRSAKRKKQPLVRATIKKPKCTPQVTNKRIKDSDTSGELSSVKSSRVLRSCRKLNAKYVSEDAPSTPGSGRKLTLKDEVRGGWNSSRSFRKSNVKDEEGGPSTRLRTRPSKLKEAKTSPAIIKKQVGKRKPERVKPAANPVKDETEVGNYACNIEGCTMSFSTKHDLALHKKDICPEKGCGKKFFSHKYLVQHRKVHMDDRPLECPWKGCEMRFKWAWARTEHIRVHTGDRPYICRECSQTFRFVSDFSRHKRKTGHLVKKGRR